MFYLFIHLKRHKAKEVNFPKLASWKTSFRVLIKDYCIIFKTKFQ